MSKPRVRKRYALLVCIAMSAFAFYIGLHSPACYEGASKLGNLIEALCGIGGKPLAVAAPASLAVVSLFIWLTAARRQKHEAA